MFTEDERAFMIMYQRRVTQPSPSYARAIPQDENPHGFAEFVWEYYAGMGNQDFHDMSKKERRGLKSLIEKGYASLGEERYYINFPYFEVNVHMDKILAKCPKGRRDVPAHVMILNGLQSETLSIYQNSRRATFVDTFLGKKLAYRLSQGEEKALAFLLNVGLLVETIHESHVMGSKMKQVILSAKSMPADLKQTN